MCHEIDLSKFQLFDDSVQISFLILSGVWISKRFVRSPPSEEIKRDYATRRKMGHQSVVQMKIVRKAVHQDDARFLARIFSGVNAMFTVRYKAFYEIHRLASCV